MNKLKKQGKTLTIKIKYANFQSITRSKALLSPLTEKTVIMNLIQALLKKTEIGARKIRLFGLSIAKLENRKHEVVQ